MLNLKEARRVIRAAEKKAHELGYTVNIAVVDESGYAVAQVRMDGARFAGIGTALNKASTARSFNMATRSLGDAIGQQGGFNGIASLGRRTVLAAGGLPLRINGEICGAIGVSGASSSDDEAIARAGAAALLAGYANGRLNGHDHEGIENPRGGLSQIDRLGQLSVRGQAQSYSPLQ